MHRRSLVFDPLKDRNRRLAWAQDYRAMRLDHGLRVRGEAAAVLAEKLHPEVAADRAGLL